MTIKRTHKEHNVAVGKIRRKRRHAVSKGTWNKLPYVALVRIFKSLKDSDRVASSQVCHTWNHAFQNPSLWRSRHFEFGGSRENAQEENAIKFAEKMGPHLKEVRVFCRHVTSNTSSLIGSTLIRFAARLHFADLLILKIVDIELDRFWKFPELRGLVADAISRLLEHQRNLQVFKMTYAQFGLLPGTDILEKLSEACGDKLRKLLIEDFFHSRMPVFQLDRYRAAIKSFTNLQIVALNYCCICEDIVTFWTHSLQGKLKRLRIEARENEPHAHLISGETWRALCRACRDLSVDFTILGVDSSEEIIRLLAPHIPLHCLHIWCGHDSDTVLGLNRTLNHVGRNYISTLAELFLDFDNEHENVDDELIEVITACKQLRTLRLKANMSSQVAVQVCKLIKEGPSLLVSVDITLTDPSLPDMEVMSDLREEMHYPTLARGIFLGLHDSVY